MRTCPTGEIEDFCPRHGSAVVVQGTAAAGVRRAGYPEDIRLKYRSLDLRRESLHKNIVQRTEDHRRDAQADGRDRLYRIFDADPDRPRALKARRLPGAFLGCMKASSTRCRRRRRSYKQLIMVSGLRPLFPDRAVFPHEDPRADRSAPGEFYQLDLEMSFVEQEDVLATMEPVMRGVFEGLFRRQAGGRRISAASPMTTRSVPTGRTSRICAIPSRCRTLRAFRGSGFKVFANILANDAEAQVWAIPAKTGASRASLRPHELVGSRGRPAGAGLHLLAQGRREHRGRGPDRQEHRRGARGSRAASSSAWSPAMPASLPPATRKNSASFAGAARTRAGEELNLVDRERFSSSAGSSTSPSTSGTRTKRRSNSPTTPSPCPQGGMEGLQGDDPLALKAYQYDLVATVLDRVGRPSATICRR